MAMPENCDPASPYLKGVSITAVKAFRGINGSSLRASLHLFHGALTE